MSSLSSSRPRLNRIAGPILGEFLIGMTVAMAGLWLASNESDAAAGAFGLSQQVLETLFVLFRVLAIGVGAGVTQALGAQRPQAAGSTALVGLGASTWAGLIAAGVYVRELHKKQRVVYAAAVFIVSRKVQPIQPEAEQKHHEGGKIDSFVPVVNSFLSHM